MGKKKNSKKASKPVNISELLEQGNIALDRADPELALKFFERALFLNKTNTQIMDTLAEVYLQLNQPERAFPLLNESIQLEPTKNPCKYLYFAQLQNNNEALESYRKGISLLEQEKLNSTSEVCLFYFFFF